MKSSNTIDPMSMVEEFHRAFDHPIAEYPTIPPMDRIDFRLNFLKEEMEELRQGAAEGNVIEVADGIVDILYVLNGLALECGMHKLLPALFAEVHRSNMSKACSSIEEAEGLVNGMLTNGITCRIAETPGGYIVSRHDGKLIKAPSYSRANLGRFFVTPFVFPQKPSPDAV